MTDQVEVKEQVRWEDLEVAEEQEITEWEEGNAPVPAFQQSLKDLSKYHVGYDPAKIGADITRGVLLAFGVTAEEFAEAMEGRARAALDQELRFAEIPVLGAVDRIDWREANKRLPGISNMVARINAFCTPTRINLTGEWGIPNDE